MRVKYLDFFTQFDMTKVNIIHEEWREGTGPMTAQQPDSQGAKAGNHEARATELTAVMAVFFVLGKGG